MDGDRVMKKFLIIGNINATTYKELFPLIKENKMWWGVSLNGTKASFVVPEDYEGKNVFYENGVKMAKVNNAIWFTNIEHSKYNQPLRLYKRYNAEEYPKYDNYNAINVDKVADIPMDYDGVIGVPITFLKYYCPSQFEIINGVGRYACIEDGTENPIGTYGTDVNGKHKYFRILIRQFEIIWCTDRGGDGMMEELKNSKWNGLWDSAFVNGKKCYKRILIRAKK